MKRYVKLVRAAGMTAVVFCALVVRAPAGEVAITNYFSGYVLVPSAFTNAGNTGLSVGNAYACIPVAALGELTEAQASGTNVTGDVRALMYALMEHLYDGVQALAVSNRPTSMVIDETVQFETSSTQILAQVLHRLRTTLVVTGSSVASE